MAGSVLFKIAGKDDEQRLVFGLASLSVTADGETYTDLQHDTIEPVELEKAFYDMVAEGHTGGDVNHDFSDVSVLVESFVVTPEKLAALLKAVGYEGPALAFKGTAAWVGYRIKDAKTWERVKSGELTGFSIEGRADREAA